ncbi:MAG: hypothetical protein ABJF23_17620 [Bryobacteraceae bacterium]
MKKCPFEEEIFGPAIALITSGQTLELTDIDALMKRLASLLGRKLTREDFQALTTGLAERLGVDPIKKGIAAQLDTKESHEDHLKKPDQTFTEIGDGIVQFAADAISICEELEFEYGPAKRVYFLRDCMWPQVADNLLCTMRGLEPSAVGVMISRSTIGLEMFDKVVNPMMTIASSQGAKSKSAFLESLNEQMTSLLASNELFSKQCDKLILHLIDRGALVVHDGQPVKQHIMFVETGYKTFPAFMKTLLEIKFSGVVHVSMLYHTVKKGFECLRSLNVKKPDDPDNDAFSAMNDTGSYAAFFKSGATLTNSGTLTNLVHGDRKRIYNSMLIAMTILQAVKRRHALFVKQGY